MCTGRTALTNQCSLHAFRKTAYTTVNSTLHTAHFIVHWTLHLNVHNTSGASGEGVPQPWLLVVGAGPLHQEGAIPVGPA